MSRLYRQPAQKPIILLYHRIADVAIDPWRLAVTPDRFEQQLEVLRKFREPLAMTDFLERLKKGRLPANAVCVTFDDGYVDNLLNAKPRLERAGVPATIFIATGFTGRAREFWWDELARLILGHVSDLDCEIVVANKRLPLTLRASSTGAPIFPRWEDWRHPRTERESLYLKVWEQLWPLPGVERERAMSNLRMIFTSGPVGPEDLPMTAAEVRALAAGTLIEIGSHSVTHPILTKLSPNERLREIKESKGYCEQLVGRRIHGFSYPHGRFDEISRAAVRDAGYRFACSTNGQFVEVDRFDRFALPRLQVENWGSDAFEFALLGINGKCPVSKRSLLGRLADLCRRFP